MRKHNRFFLFALLSLTLVTFVAPSLLAYKAVYLGSALEINSNPYRNATDERLLYNALRWAADKAGPIRVVVIPSQGAEVPSWWTSFDGLYADITITFITYKPLTLAQIQASGADVMGISNAWHGPPAIVPAPNPGGSDWVFQASDQAAIQALLANVCRQASFRRQLSLNLPYGFAPEPILATGFNIQQTLIWMQIKFQVSGKSSCSLFGVSSTLF